MCTYIRVINVNNYFLSRSILRERIEECRPQPKPVVDELLAKLTIPYLGGPPHEIQLPVRERELHRHHSRNRSLDSFISLPGNPYQDISSDNDLLDPVISIGRESPISSRDTSSSMSSPRTGRDDSLNGVFQTLSRSRTICRHHVRKEFSETVGFLP